MVKDSKNVEITVIVPNYNTAAYLPDTIRSIQNFLEHYTFEIIVVDDGSSKNDFQKLHAIESNVVQVILAEHTGVSHARNIGINAAHGRYIMFCDADDELLAPLPRKKYQADLISFSTNCRKTRDIRNAQTKAMLISSLFGFDQSASDFPAVYGGSVSKLFRRSFLNEHNIRFDEHLANSEDLLFNIQTIVAAENIRVERRGVYLYKQRSTSVTHSFDQNLLANHVYFIECIRGKLSRIDNSLFERISSLYLYQLIFRLFAFSGNYHQEYALWRKKIGQKSKWSKQLSRPVERETIFLVNHFGITSAVYFARTYLLVKRLVKKQKVSSEVL